MVSAIEQEPSKNVDNEQNHGVEHISTTKRNGEEMNFSIIGHVHDHIYKNSNHIRLKL